MRLRSPSERVVFWGILVVLWYSVPFTFTQLLHRWGVNEHALSLARQDNEWLLQLCFLVLALISLGFLRRWPLKQILFGRAIFKEWKKRGSLAPYISTLLSEFFYSSAWICILVASSLFLGFASLELPVQTAASFFPFFLSWLTQVLVLFCWVCALDRLRYELWNMWVKKSPNPTLSIGVLCGLEFLLIYKLFVGNMAITQEVPVFLLVSASIIANILTMIASLELLNSSRNERLSKMMVHTRRLGWQMGFWWTSYMVFGQWRAGFKGISWAYLFSGKQTEIFGEFSKIGWWGQTVALLGMCLMNLWWLRRQMLQAQMKISYHEIFDTREVVKALTSR